MGRPPVRKLTYSLKLVDYLHVQTDNPVDWPQSLKQVFINVSYHILVATLTLMAVQALSPELD